MSVLSQELSLELFLTCLDPVKKKNLLASFLIGCLKVAPQKSSVAKPSRRKMVGVSVIIFCYLSLQSWTGVQWEGASRLGDHFTFHFWISGLHEGFLHCMGIKSCCSDSLVTRFPAAQHRHPGLLSSYSNGDLTWGNEGCSNTIPFALFLLWFSNMK